MKMSRMQDIGGCRAVVSSVRQVQRLARKYAESSFKHVLLREADYIEYPQTSGYRGIHLIYGYHNPLVPEYDGLQIEVQLRSRRMHAWATAVEIVGTFTQQALKSSQGEADWLRFFALMGTAIARQEQTPFVPDTPGSRNTLQRELREYDERLGVRRVLEGFQAGLQVTEDPQLGLPPDAHYFLLVLDSQNRTVSIRGYPKALLQFAQTAYQDQEKAIADHPGMDAVLVAVQSLKSLRKAYPNYFLDTNRVPRNSA
jgi:hypothetical protein